MNRTYIVILIAILGASIVFTRPLDQLLPLLLAIPGLILAITFHEFAHAKTAELLGDHTPRSQGRISLNPVKHVSLLGLVALFTVRVGWGKPVMVNPNNFTKIKNKKIGEALVAVAGPITNLLIAFFITLGYALLLKNNVSFGEANTAVIIHGIITIMISVNLGLAVFNLLPIPPLDGFSIFALVLPKGMKEEIENNQLIISAILLVLIWTGILFSITMPILQFIMDNMLKLVYLIVGF